MIVQSDWLQNNGHRVRAEKELMLSRVNKLAGKFSVRETQANSAAYMDPIDFVSVRYATGVDHFSSATLQL